MGGGGLALNQLLVVMDGIDEPPLMKRFRTRRFNTFLDAIYIVPQRCSASALRLQAAEAAQGGDLLHRGLQRAAASSWTRRSPARAAWAATSTSARPRGRTGATSSTSTSARSRTRRSSTRRRRRDELARITNGYSPAMIDQACSLALTYAHSDGRERFSRKDLVEAMTTVEAGVAIGQPYPKHEERATAIHEAGHAVCGHLYMENRLSTRLSIRKRGSSGGHHQAMEIEDRFGALALRGGRRPDLGARRDGRRARLLRPEHDRRRRRPGLGDGARRLHGRLPGMAPAPIDLSDRIADREAREKARSGSMERFERIGTRSCTAPRRHDDEHRSARRSATAASASSSRGLLGQAFVDRLRDHHAQQGRPSRTSPTA